MGNIGFWEIILIALIAVFVLKPEDLPKIAQSVGLKIGQARRFLHALTQGWLQDPSQKHD